MSLRERLQGSFIGRILEALLLFLLAPALVGLAAALVNIANQMTVNVGNQQIQVGMLVSIIVAFMPIMLIIAGLRKLGVWI